MIDGGRQLHQHARVLQNRATAVTALFMTLFLLCIEHVRAFANQYHISAHDAAVLASAASSLTRKLSSTYLASGSSLTRATTKGPSVLCVRGKASRAEGRTTTQLNAWSVPTIAMPPMPSMPTSKALPLHALGSWYSEVDPTTKPPVYDDEYDNAFTYQSADDWSLSTTDMEEAKKSTKRHMRRGPLSAIRSVAGRFKDIVVK